MAPNLSSSSIFPIIILASILLLAKPAHAFGAGNIPGASGLEGYNWRHGDITDLLLALPFSFKTKLPFTALDVSRVYFGNWLRDFSQLIDAGTLGSVPEPLLRAVVSILGFLEFGYATNEFDVSKGRLGVYRPEHHIDNPKGYDSKELSAELRGPVEQKELDIDERTGMKNYIANETIGIATSSAYIREQLTQAIFLGRQGRNNHDAKCESLIHLGAALHCLEDFAAHSNYIELCLILLNKLEPKIDLGNVFPFVGDGLVTQTKRGPAPPLVTGTFGPLDLYQSILGEIDDKSAARNLNELDQRLGLGDNLEGAADALKVILSTLTMLHVIPATVVDRIDSVRKNAERQVATRPDWGQYEKYPSQLWDSIQPVFALRDEVAKSVSEHLSIPGVKQILTKLSEAVDTFVFAILSIYVKPIIGKIRETMLKEKDRLTEKEKEAVQKGKKESIFSAKSTASDPTHSQLAKDHFDSVLNTPAGLIATVTTNLTTQAIVQAWDNDASPDSVIDKVLQVLHHPFNADPGSSFQTEMLAVVKLWWDLKSPNQQSQLRALLSKAAVESNTNHVHFDPATFNNPRGVAKFNGSAPDIAQPEKTLGQKLVSTVTGLVEISQPLNASQIKAMLDTLATPENPNPLDRTLGLLGGDFVKAFEGISQQDLKAWPNMGNILKDSALKLGGFEKKPIEIPIPPIPQLAPVVSEVVQWLKPSWTRW